MHTARIRQMLLLTFSVCFLLGTVFYSKEVAESVRSGIALCMHTVIPSLFPFFILSSVIITSGLAQCIGKPLGCIMKPLFRVNGSCAAAAVIGWIAGYPVGAGCAAALYRSGQCSKSEAERLICFCNTSGPGFIIGMVGMGIFKNACIGIMLYIIHIAAAILCGIAFRFHGKHADYSPKPLQSLSCSISSVFTGAIRTSLISCAGISAFIICFGIIITLLQYCGVLTLINSICRFFNISPDITQSFFCGLLELTNGINNILHSGGTLHLHIILTSALLGWGGVSVHCQTLSEISKTDISAKPYLLSKILHGILSAILAAVVLRFEPIEQLLQTFSPLSKAPYISELNIGITTMACGSFLLLLLFSLIFFYELWENGWKSSIK